MKVFITNKEEFEELFNYPLDDIKYKNSRTIHKDLFNKVFSNFETKNLIEVVTLIPYKKYDGDGDCIFVFLGKNKDMFFYEFQSTAS